MHNRHIVIPIFIPHKGCPFDCIYCNQKLISGQIEDVTIEKMDGIIESYLSTIEKDTHVEIGFYGGSFTGIDTDQQINYLKNACKYIKKGLVKEIRLSTRPDYINHEILEYLKKYGVKTIELGVQSLDEDVLIQSCRGHSIDSVIKSSQLIKTYGFNLGIQTMIGLPGDTKLKDFETAKKVVELGPEIVRIYPTLVIRNTYLEKLYLSGKYRPLSLEEAVEICSEILELYNENNINVIRIGLQPSENINLESDVVAGPFHPSFRQLVESRLTLHRIIDFIEKKKLTDENGILIYTGGRNISNVTGLRKANLNFLKDRYNFKVIKVRENNSLESEIMIKKLEKL